MYYYRGKAMFWVITAGILLVAGIVLWWFKFTSLTKEQQKLLDVLVAHLNSAKKVKCLMGHYDFKIYMDDEIIVEVSRSLLESRLQANGSTTKLNEKVANRFYAEFKRYQTQKLYEAL
jgi:cytochrome b subunit of formate dehydrogenase